MSNKKIIFNTSMPRSGSELLQCILNQNPKIYGSATSPLLEYQFASRNNYELAEVKAQDPELMKNAFINMCAGMAKSYYEPITEKEIVCDKNRGWMHYYSWVTQWNGDDTKMICMIRDLRSIIASFERIYRENRFSPQGIDNPAQIQNMTSLQRANYWLNTQPVGLALARLADAIDQGNDKKILFVKYEDFCSNPEKEMARVYGYLGEENFEHDFNNIKKTVKEDSSFFGIFGNHDVKNKITPEKKASYLDVLNKNVCKHITDTHEWYFDHFNY